MFLPQPLKIYRRELAGGIDSKNNCNNRTSASISLLNAPGSTINNSQSSTANQQGLVNTLNTNLVNSKYEIPGAVSQDTCAIGTPQSNARARLRSRNDKEKLRSVKQ